MRNNIQKSRISYAVITRLVLPWIITSMMQNEYRTIRKICIHLKTVVFSREITFCTTQQNSDLIGNKPSLNWAATVVSYFYFLRTCGVLTVIKILPFLADLWLLVWGREASWVYTWESCQLFSFCSPQWKEAGKHHWNRRKNRICSDL